MSLAKVDTKNMLFQFVLIDLQTLLPSIWSTIARLECFQFGVYQSMIIFNSTHIENQRLWTVGLSFRKFLNVKVSSAQCTRKVHQSTSIQMGSLYNNFGQPLIELTIDLINPMSTAHIASCTKHTFLPPLCKTLLSPSLSLSRVNDR